jgi:hypothetical protein
MAPKRKRRPSGARRFLFYILLPLFVWTAAFFVWFYWHDLKKLTLKASAPGDGSKAGRRINGDEREKRPSKGGGQEKIQEEDRQRLEDIIKRRS